MDSIIIKPHHFLDIIKLHGAGLEQFVPDEKMGHDFYKIGNLILGNPNVLMKLTLGADDICTPCKYCENSVCMDELNIIPGYTEKNTYNKELDRRIVEHFDLDLEREYKASELCQIYLSQPTFIYEIWKEENDEVTQRRYELFIKGAEKYLSDNSDSNQ